MTHGKYAMVFILGVLLGAGVTIGSLVIAAIEYNSNHNDTVVAFESTVSATTESPMPTATPVPTEYGPGTLKVGVDIPPGTHRGRLTRDNVLDMCAWTIRDAPPPNGDVLGFGVEQGPFYVELEEGQYIQLSGCVLK